jgi:dUTPase
MIILRNEGPERFTVCHGDRIAQILLNKLTPTSVTEYFEDAPLLSSRAGGLGSTGR